MQRVGARHWRSVMCEHLAGLKANVHLVSGWHARFNEGPIGVSAARTASIACGGAVNALLPVGPTHHGRRQAGGREGDLIGIVHDFCLKP
jgi:hypothetical protein